MKKKIMLGVSVVSCFFVAGLTLMAGRNLNNFVKTRSSSYSLTLNSSNTPDSLTASFQDKVTGVVKTMGDYDATFDFVYAKTASGKFVELAPHGKIINFGADDQNFNGVNFVSFTGSGSLTIRTAKAGQAGAAYLNKPIALSSTPVAVPVSNYFELEAGDSGAVIETLELTYSCDASDYDIKALDGTYTGVGSDTSTWQLDVNNGACTIKSLDKQTNMELSGTAEMVSATRAQCTFTYMGQPINYVVDVSADKHSLTYVSKSGTYAAGVAEINFDRVYTLQDFESFTATGNGYTQTNDKTATTNLRSAFYGDYYPGSGSSPIGGSGWQLMGGTSDYLTFAGATKGHNDSKAGIFKGNSNKLRYISINSLYGVPEVIGKGSTLSFWAKGPSSNTALSADATVNASITAYAFSESQITPSNQQTARESQAFTVEVGSDWKEYKMALTPGRAYFGFGFYCYQSGNTYTPIDDIKIYTASPYAEYVPPAAVSGVELDDDAIELSVGGTSTLTATVLPNNATNKNVTWTSSDGSVATVEDGVVTAVGAGNATITVTTVDGGFTDTCDVTVTAPTSIAYPSGVFVGNVNVNSNNLPMIIALGDETNGVVEVRINNTTSASATGVTFNHSTGAVSITTTGSYLSQSFGTISGTYNPGTHTIENISCSGSIKTYISNNGSINVTRPEKYWDCNGTKTELRDIFKRRYMSGGWQTNDKNIDRLMSDTTHYVSGSALQNIGYASGAVALNIYNDFSPAVTVSNIGFWVYNPSANDIALRQWVYQVTNLATGVEIGGATAKAGQWSFCVMGFTSAAIYNLQIADFNNSNVALTYDDIFLY